MLSVRLSVNSKLLVVKFGGVESYMQIFDWAGRIGTRNPHIVQGSIVLYNYSYQGNVEKKKDNVVLIVG